MNNLALHALTAAFAADHAIVDEKAARIVVNPDDAVVVTFNDAQQVVAVPKALPPSGT